MRSNGSEFHATRFKTFGEYMGVYKNAGELPVRRDCELLTVDSKQIQSLQERMRVAKSERESRKFPREH